VHHSFPSLNLNFIFSVIFGAILGDFSFVGFGYNWGEIS
jgi:hypothetical protein